MPQQLHQELGLVGVAAAAWLLGGDGRVGRLAAAALALGPGQAEVGVGGLGGGLAPGPPAGSGGRRAVAPAGSPGPAGPSPGVGGRRRAGPSEPGPDDRARERPAGPAPSAAGLDRLGLDESAHAEDQRGDPRRVRISIRTFILNDSRTYLPSVSFTGRSGDGLGVRGVAPRPARLGRSPCSGHISSGDGTVSTDLWRMSEGDIVRMTSLTIRDGSRIVSILPTDGAGWTNRRSSKDFAEDRRIVSTYSDVGVLHSGIRGHIISNSGLRNRGDGPRPPVLVIPPRSTARDLPRPPRVGRGSHRDRPVAARLPRRIPGLRFVGLPASPRTSASGINPRRHLPLSSPRIGTSGPIRRDPTPSRRPSHGPPRPQVTQS